MECVIGADIVCSGIQCVSDAAYIVRSGVREWYSVKCGIECVMECVISAGIVCSGIQCVSDAEYIVRSGVREWYSVECGMECGEYRV